MSVSIPIEMGYEFGVKAPFAEVFGVLADVPESVSHFPKVDRLVDEGGGVYRWEMARVGTAQVHLQTVYASRYVSNKRKGTVTWTPVPGVGNAQIGGSWAIVDKKGWTHLTLHIDGTVDVALPPVMKPVVAVVVQAEFESLVERYIDNLIARFGGEVEV